MRCRPLRMPGAVTHWLGFYLVGERHGHTERRAGVEIILIEPIEYRIGLGNCHGGQIDGQKRRSPHCAGFVVRGFLYVRQCLCQVGAQVFDVFNPDRQPHQTITDP
ncbi:hypothetical protein QE391_001366 [Pseudomonas fluorescens]|nr:hypothetical protein [Pseudomonas fluorescens]